MRIRIGFMLIVATLGGQVLAAPFTVAYEGNDFPENEGWRRRTTGGGAERSIEDGQLVLDGRASVEVTDAYVHRGHSISLQPGDSFFAEWQLTLEENDGLIGDASIGIFTDEGGHLSIEIGPDEIRLAYTEELVEFALHGPVTFRLESTDLHTYDLIANGDLIHTGQFRQLVLSDPRVTWGDGVVGTASVTRWDYFRFGVIPEGGGGLCCSVAFLILLARRITR